MRIEKASYSHMNETNLEFHMKTITQRALVLIALLCCGSAFSQGTFYFINYDSIHGLDAPVYDASGKRLEGANFVAMLYGGVTMDSLQAIAPASPFLTGSLAGYFFDRQNYVRAVPGVVPGGPAWVQVRAWDARLGDSYEQVAALGTGGYGESNLFRLNSGGCLQCEPSYLVGLQSFSLVPEPSSLLLVLLALPWLFVRWRHSK
jgi:hypothetical protein